MSRIPIQFDHVHALTKYASSFWKVVSNCMTMICLRGVGRVGDSGGWMVRERENRFRRMKVGGKLSEGRVGKRGRWIIW